VKDRSGIERVVLGDDTLIAAGAKVLCPKGATLTVGRGTWVAANAVLTKSTGEYEVWGGIPSSKIGDHPQKPN
jgi:serine O-acetyltransferase